MQSATAAWGRSRGCGEETVDLTESRMWPRASFLRRTASKSSRRPFKASRYLLMPCVTWMPNDKSPAAEAAKDNGSAMRANARHDELNHEDGNGCEAWGSIWPGIWHLGEGIVVVNRVHSAEGSEKMLSCWATPHEVHSLGQPCPTALFLPPELDTSHGAFGLVFMPIDWAAKPPKCTQPSHLYACQGLRGMIIA